MTISTLYVPEQFATNSDREYAFTFPAADDASIEVYEIITVDAVDYRYLVPVQDYTLHWNSPNPRYPLKRNGVVRFTRRHSVDTAAVRIERNTLIDQTIDLPTLDGSFSTRMIEFAFDKHTMICQEISDRKCDVATTTPITQLITFGSYSYLPAKQINFAVEKLFNILFEIDASGTDCSDDLEGT